MRPERAVDHSPPSSPGVMEQSYTSTQSLGHTGPVMGSLYLYILCLLKSHEDLLRAEETLPPVSYLHTSWEWSVSFTPQPTYPEGTSLVPHG